MNGGSTHTATEQAETTLYLERQPMHRNMLIRVLIPLEMLVVLGLVVPLVAVKGGSHMPMTLVILTVVIALPLWLMFITLETRVTDRRVIIRFAPFPGREVDLARVQSAKAVKYNALADAGGWGWRASHKYHRVFNITGDRGVHLVYGEDKKDQFLVGSDRAEELAEAIDLARGTVA